MGETQYAVFHDGRYICTCDNRQIAGAIVGYCTKQPHAPADAVLDELIEFTRWVQQKQPEALAIMEKQGIVIDNLDDKMQKFAFTLYTDLCEIESRARHMFDDAALRAREVQHGKNIPMVDRGAPDRYTSVSLEEWERMQRGDPHG